MPKRFDTLEGVYQGFYVDLEKEGTKHGKAVRGETLGRSDWRRKVACGFI